MKKYLDVITSAKGNKYRAFFDEESRITTITQSLGDKTYSVFSSFNEEQALTNAVLTANEIER